MANKLVGYRISQDSKERISEFADEYGNGMSNRFIDALCLYADTGEPVVNEIRIKEFAEDLLNGKWLSGRLTGKILKADQVIYQNFKEWLDNGEDGFGEILLELLCSYDTVKQFLADKPLWIEKIQEYFLESEKGHPLKVGTITRYLTLWYAEKEENGDSSRTLAAVIRKKRAARLRSDAE